jgi:predicted dehydrogenase
MNPLRLHVSFDVPERDAILAAASRIPTLAVVESETEADAIVAFQDLGKWPKDRPVLQLGELPTEAPTNVYPALPSRFDPHAQAIRRRLDAGDLGRPGLARLHVWSSTSEALNHRNKIDAIDLVLWLIGEDIESSFATQSQANQVIHLGFVHGAMALIDFYDQLPADDRYRSLTVIGSDGAAYADDHRDRNLFFASGDTNARPPATGYAHLGPMLEDFASCIRNNGDAAHAQRTYRAAETILKELLP